MLVLITTKGPVFFLVQIDLISLTTLPIKIYIPVRKKRGPKSEEERVYVPGCFYSSSLMRGEGCIDEIFHTRLFLLDHNVDQEGGSVVLRAGSCNVGPVRVRLRCP